MAENKSNIGTNLVIGVLSLIAVFSLVDLSKEINKIFSPARIEKPSQLEIRAKDFNKNDSNETIIYDRKTGINYLVKYTKGDTLGIFPYSEGGK